MQASDSGGGGGGGTVVETPPVVVEHALAAQFELADDVAQIPIVCALGDHPAVQFGSAATVHSAALPTVQFIVNPDSGMQPRDVFYEALREAQRTLEGIAAAMEEALGGEDVGELSAFDMEYLAEKGINIQRGDVA